MVGRLFLTEARRFGLDDEPLELISFSKWDVLVHGLKNNWQFTALLWFHQQFCVHQNGSHNHSQTLQDTFTALLKLQHSGSNNFLMRIL
jgi:hypothetical protein